MFAPSVTQRLVRKCIARHVPLQVHLDLTYRCNENCIHCYLDHGGAEGELSELELSDLFDALRRAGTLHLTLSGGEIFLRSDLMRILLAARARNFDITLQSNGTLIDDQMAARLKEIGVRSVQISMYSADPEIHDEITRVPGSQRRSLDAVSALLQRGLGVKLASPLLRNNFRDYQALLDMASQFGITCVLDPTISPGPDRNASVTSHRVEVSELAPVLTDPRLHSTKSGLDTFSDRPEDCSYSDDVPCSAGHSSCYISPYGQVYPCVQWPLSLGNLREQSFEEIWTRSPQLCSITAVRKRHLAGCSNCAIQTYCERCPGLAYLEDGAFDGPSQRACELAEKRAELNGNKT